MSWLRSVMDSFRQWRFAVAVGVMICSQCICTIADAQQKQPLIKKLDGPTRAKVLAALAGLVILGFAMVALAWLGARVTRRYMKGTSYLRPTPRPERSDWSPQPLKAGDKLADDPDDESGS